jgi:Glycosyltransferase
LFFGLLRPFKGVKFLIEGFEGIPKELMANTRLFIVGEAWEDRESVDRARRSEYRDNITVVDRYISDDEVSLYFSASDVFVAPYTRESHDPSAVAHIAMSYGMPVIASRVGGIKESLGTYEGTVFVEPENPGEIAKAIQALHGDRVRYPVPPELRWNVIAQQWDDLIRTIMQEEMRQ